MTKNISSVFNLLLPNRKAAKFFYRTRTIGDVQLNAPVSVFHVLVKILALQHI